MTLQSQGVNVLFGGDAGPLGKVVNQAVMFFQKFALTQNITATALKRTGIAVAGVAFVLVPAIKEAIRFQTEMAELTKVLGEFEGSQVANEMAKLSTQLPIARTELNEVAAAAARLGVRGVENLREFTKVMAEIGVATDITAHEASESFVRLAAVTKTPIPQIRNLANVANELTNQMGTNFRELITSSSELAPILSSFGLSAPEIMAVAAALNEVNVSVRRGGRQLRSFFDQVSDINKMEKFAQILGITKQEFAELLTQDMLELLRRFAELMAEGGKESFEIAQILDSAATQGIRSFSQNLEGLNKSLAVMKQEMKDNNSLAKEANVFYDTAANKSKLLGQRIDELQRLLGEKFLPVWEGVLQVSLDILDVWTKIIASPLEEFMNEDAARQFTLALSAQQSFWQRIAQVITTGPKGRITPVARLLSSVGLDLEIKERTDRFIAILNQVDEKARGVFLRLAVDPVKKMKDGIISLDKMWSELLALISVAEEKASEVLEGPKDKPTPDLGGTTDTITNLLEGLNIAEVQKALEQFGILKEQFDELLATETGQRTIQALLDIAIGLREIEKGAAEANTFRELVGLLPPMSAMWMNYAAEMDELIQKRNELNDFFNDTKKGLQEEIDLLRGVAKSTEEWRIKTSELSDERKRELLELLRYRDALKELKDEQEEARKEYERLVEAYQKRLDDLNLVTLQSQFRLLERTADEMADSFVRMFEEMGKGAANAGEAIINMIRSIAMELLRNRLAAFFGALLSGLIAAPTAPQSGQLASAGGFKGSMRFLPGKQHGGPVSPNLPFLVGERGPEVFVPRTAGTIVPTDKRGGPSITVQNTFHIKALDGASVRDILSREADFLATQSAHKIARSDFLKRMVN